MTKQEKIITNFLNQNEITFEDLIKTKKDRYELVSIDDIKLRRFNYKKISVEDCIIRFGSQSLVDKKFYCEFLKEK